MMIDKNEKICIKYINKLTNRIFKILPLFEEEDEGLEKYMHSLIFELEGLPNTIGEIKNSEFITLLATLHSLYEELIDDNFVKNQETHSLVKREVFKCVNIVKKLGREATYESGVS